MTKPRNAARLVMVAALLGAAPRISAQDSKAARDTGATAGATMHVLRVITPDSQPVAYANVSVKGAATRITNERGELPLGAGHIGRATVDVRRIGFTPWFSTLDFPDSATVVTVTLTRTAQSLAETRVTGRMTPTSPFVQGFYDRWLERQKGLLSGTFISPEELEFRHPDRITTVLRGLNGVAVERFVPPTQGGNRMKASDGGSLPLIAMSTGAPNCPMAIVIDGKQHYPDPVPGTMPPVYVTFLDQIVSVSDVMAIEVYPRGGNMPLSLQVDDTRCGVIAFWTGSRK